MRIAIVSDVHSNMPALASVLKHARGGGAVDAIWCLGDIVGYGAEPGAVIAALRAEALTSVAGNHDLAACGKMGTEEFNPVAAAAAIWTERNITADERAFLAGLPLTAIAGTATLVHGSLRAPEWEYLLDPEQASAHFALQTTPYSLVGHSHLTFYVEERADGEPSFAETVDGDALKLGDGRLILNPGSVGQPRDGDPRASYLLYDQSAATMTWHRVEYDIGAAQRAIIDAGLPQFLAERLAVGR